VGGEDPALGAQRDEVRDGAERGQVEVVLHRDGRAAFVAGEAEDLQHAMDELEDQSGRAERLPRSVLGVVDARVDEGAGDAGFLGDVVVHDDDVDAFGPGGVRPRVLEFVPQSSATRRTSLRLASASTRSSAAIERP
jgi:hypothetical protein